MYRGNNDANRILNLDIMSVSHLKDTLRVVKIAGNIHAKPGRAKLCDEIARDLMKTCSAMTESSLFTWSRGESCEILSLMTHCNCLIAD